MLDTIQKRRDTALEDDPASGTYRNGCEIFTDPEIFELEMNHLFEGNWIYLAHESQISNNNDYFITTMGRQPIFIARGRTGELNAFINAYSHRGAMLFDMGRAAHWNDMSRGAQHWIQAADGAAEAIGLKPLLSRLC
jgi:benzoate/toluate 1,2-dioxygenase alpha subunit